MDRAVITDILFDLDGTITDSYAGLQHAFDFAYQQVYHCSSTYNIKPLVGPPMRQIFKKLTGEQKEEKTDAFIKIFQHQYDTESYQMCELFSGMEIVLKQLFDAGINMYVATNKRLKPTESVLEHLGIAKYFKAVYSIDSVQPSYANKALMVKDILQQHHLQPEHTLFIGDTLHDQHGAEENGLKFIYAAYGFGDLENLPCSITEASGLLDYL